MLFICGSLNQTTQLHAIARELAEAIATFSPFYSDAWVEWLSALGLIEFTIAGRKLRRRCEAYLQAHGLPIDFRGRAHAYDLVVTCTDLVVPRNAGGRPLLVVQEGMIDPESWISRVVHRGRLPRWLAGTTLTGLSGRYDRFCVASEGYKQLLVRRGAPADRLVVTGIPNFDDCRGLLNNDLPERGYVLACTSDLRETFRPDRRDEFIARVCRIAAGRPIHFKLHPNENHARARREIERGAPGAKIHTDTNTELLIANCDVLVTQSSSVTFIGVALGKQVETDLDLAELRALCPIQNGGRSAARIADVCRELLGLPPPESERTAARIPTLSEVG